MRACDPYSGGLLKFYALYSIDTDVKAKQAKHRGSGSGRAIGGRSLWGGLLDIACAKYGWTLHYVLWEISYLNLNMMLADAITVDYDKPSAEASGARFISADDPNNSDLIIGQYGQIK